MFTDHGSPRRDFMGLLKVTAYLGAAIIMTALEPMFEQGFSAGKSGAYAQATHQEASTKTTERWDSLIKEIPFRWGQLELKTWTKEMNEMYDGFVFIVTVDFIRTEEKPSIYVFDKNPSDGIPEEIKAQNDPKKLAIYDDTRERGLEALKKSCPKHILDNIKKDAALQKTISPGLNVNVYIDDALKTYSYKMWYNLFTKQILMRYEKELPQLTAEWRRTLSTFAKTYPSPGTATFWSVDLDCAKCKKALLVVIDKKGGFRFFEPEDVLRDRELKRANLAMNLESIEKSPDLIVVAKTRYSKDPLDRYVHRYMKYNPKDGMLYNDNDNWLSQSEAVLDEKIINGVMCVRRTLDGNDTKKYGKGEETGADKRFVVGYNAKTFEVAILRRDENGKVVKIIRNVKEDAELRQILIDKGAISDESK
jgi:hypothetical protein